VVELPAGGKATVRVRIQRHGGLVARTPLALMNLPFQTKVPDIGLNGILINEGETERTIVITAEPDATPGEQTLVPVARAETRGRNLEYAGPVVRLRVLPRPTAGGR
jgi:hypothetical protein